MSLLLPKHRLCLTLGLTVPVAIFFAARSAASWRPQFVARQDEVFNPWSCGSHFLRLSPDEKWLVSEGDDHLTSTLWSLERLHKKRTFRGIDAVFSPNSRLIASWDANAQEIFVNDFSRLKWRKALDEITLEPQIRFTPNNSQLQYHQLNPEGIDSDFGDLLISLDANTGKQQAQDKLEISRWQTDHYATAEHGGMTQISLIDPKGDKWKPIYFLQTSNAFDQWAVAPDGKHLWVSREKQKNFDIHDAKTGRKVWSYSFTNSIKGEFVCYPSWENGGKTLTTIENDTLQVRDSNTGKILLSHKNNLRTALKSWVFTRDRQAVYLMDVEGRIFRQRLS